MADARRQFKLELGCCMLCIDAWRTADFWPRWLEVHEIVRGASRSKGVKMRCAWLVLCRQHHDQMGDLSVWPVERQLALKKITDPEWYDRVAVNVARGRAPQAITEAEVDRHVALLLIDFPDLQWFGS